MVDCFSDRGRKAHRRELDGNVRIVYMLNLLDQKESEDDDLVLVSIPSPENDLIRADIESQIANQ